MAITLPRTVALGRIEDLIRPRSDADRIALRPGQGSFDDYLVRRFASRDAMRLFLRGRKAEDEGWAPVIYDKVRPGMQAWRYERIDPSLPRAY